MSGVSVNLDAQLARIARAKKVPVEPEPSVHAVFIYQLDRGFPIWIWLCAEHLAVRTDEKLSVKERWFVKEKRTPTIPLTCDDCPRERDPWERGLPR